MHKTYGTYSYSLTLAILMPILLLLTMSQLYAQAPSQALEFKSGTEYPLSNIEDYQRGDLDLSPYLFEGKYHLLVQFEELPNAASRQIMRQEGLVLKDYMPKKAYFAELSPSLSANRLAQWGVRTLFPLQPKHKGSEAFEPENLPEWAQMSDGYLRISLTLSTQMDRANFQREAQKLQLRPPFREAFQIVYDNVIAEIPKEKLSQLFDKPWVNYIEPAGQPLLERNRPGRANHGVDAASNPHYFGLDGEGIRIGEWDGGVVGPHIDFDSRLVNKEGGGSSGHATHVGGTVIGGGHINPAARGMAPKATLFAWNYTAGSSNAEMQNAMDTPADRVQLMTHSWGNGFVGCGGGGTPGNYDANARFIDLLVDQYPTLAVQWAIGNTQGSGCVAGGFRSITNGWEISKNSIGVGALTQALGETTYSSYGPVRDGRLKPEICGVGTQVFSTIPNNNYQNQTGTSMSTPGVSGALTLLYEWYRDNTGAGTYPSIALVKAVVLNNALDLGNVGPDYKYGYGNINIKKAIEALDENRYLESNVDNGNTNTHTITVPAGTKKLNVILSWKDPAAALNANPALVNNLDIRVIDPSSGSNLPWLLNPANPAATATTGVDNLNNVEQVTIIDPPAGTYTIEVEGTNVPSGPQDYAISWTVDAPYIEITYPVGGESLISGAQYRVTWEAEGVTGNQTLQYSLDGGTTWVNISTTINQNQRQFNWTTPGTANTHQARVRVQQGALSGMSPNNFNILQRPTALNATAICGGVNLTWTAAAGANEYEVFRLDLPTSEYVSVGTTTATNFSVTGLPSGTYWFTVKALTTAGAVSERALAVSAVVDGIVDDLELLAIENPICVTAIPATEDIIVRIKNVSCDAFPAGTNIPLSYTYDGTTVNETFTLAAPLAVDAEITYTFATPINITAVSPNEIDAQINYPTDANPANDVITGYEFGSIVTTLPYFESFEEPNPGTCWTRTQLSATGGFKYGTPAALSSAFFNIPPATDGTQAAITNDDECNCNSSEDYLISPKFDFSAYSSVNLEVDVFRRDNFGPGEAFVKISTTSVSGPWTTLVTIANNDAWQTLNIDLDAYAGESDVWIAFHYDDNGAWGYGLGVDRFLLCSGDAPIATALNPAHTATDVSINTDLVITFDTDITAGTGSLTITDGTTPITIPITDPAVSIAGNTLTVNLPAALAYNTTYNVIVPAGFVKNECQVDFAGITTGNWTFTTENDDINALCQDIVVEVDATGSVNVNATAIDGGSTGTITSYTFQDTGTPNKTFDCTDIGDNTVTLVVSDGTSTSTCTATVTVQDNIAPVLTAKPDYTRSVDAGECDFTNGDIP
ncbi:MAG: S8 family serine peptidase, partial [Bernardetiaceae bacterium]|nr:S8 family serine peptidase [Bernardetiaceae bacterium]